MAFCPRCGVRLDADVRICPVCTTAVPPVDGDSETTVAPWPTDTPYARTYLSPAEIRQRVLAVLAGLLLLPMIIVLAVDFYTSGGFDGGRLSWSLLVSWILLCSLGYLISGFLTYHAFLPITLWFMGISAALLAGIDALDNAPPWFLPLGLPILGALAGSLILAYAVILRLREKGYNVFGVATAALGLFLMALDALIFVYLKGRPSLSWSVLTAIILFSITAYLFILHYLYRWKLDLGKTFHF